MTDAPTVCFYFFLEQEQLFGTLPGFYGIKITPYCFKFFSEGFIVFICLKELLHNLAECDVKAVPCSKAELFNMLHTHYHPITGNRFRYDDLLESNWDSRIMPYREDTDLEESFTDELIDEMLYGGLQNG